ncbi:hypothetical protein KAT63_04010 [Candidatus Parcubacteria bacterium]|nr:hypothetical protein [Candidatus Parcubacteria bacterium]
MDKDDKQIAEQRQKKVEREALKEEKSNSEEESVIKALSLLNKFHEGECWELNGLYDGGDENRGENMRVMIIGKDDDRKIALSHVSQSDWIEFSFSDLVKEIMKENSGDARANILYLILKAPADENFLILE